jgi:protein-S-isoprenylcysteine O-methyltransferase Ste14
MELIKYAPLAAIFVITAATIGRGIAIRRKSGDRPLAIFDATGIQRIAGFAFAVSIIALTVASAITETGPAPSISIIGSVLALSGAALVIAAQVQMGRAWRIGVRGGDAPLFISHGLFRFSRNPIFVGMMLVGLACALSANLWWAWAALVVFAGSCAVQVRIEEDHLQRRFGAAYHEYRRKVPRWLGIARSAAALRVESLIDKEMDQFAKARHVSPETAWHHLERSHILSQPFLALHFANHCHMLGFAWKLGDKKEMLGQVLRLLLAPIGTVTGQIPIGNTGRSNISAFKTMPIPADLRETIGDKTE